MGKIPQWTPRLWEPVWPKNGDLIMDMSYFSVQPCRPGGVPLDCCLLNIEEDEQETNPLQVDCSVLSLKGKKLFAIEDGCPKDSKGDHLNPICIEPDGIDEGALPSKFSLWSHYGAGGPFTNSKGVPIDDFRMKCACLSVDPSIEQSEVNFFTLPVFSPSECVNRTNFGVTLQGVQCDGVLTFDLPQGDYMDEFEKEGFNIMEYEKVVYREITQRIALDFLGMIDTLKTYSMREGFTEWPNVSKFPFVGERFDTCKEKGISPVPWPVEAINPYMLGLRDPRYVF